MRRQTGSHLYKLTGFQMCYLSTWSWSSTETLSIGRLKGFKSSHKSFSNPWDERAGATGASPPRMMSFPQSSSDSRASLRTQRGFAPERPLTSCRLASEPESVWAANYALIQVFARHRETLSAHNWNLVKWPKGWLLLRQLLGKPCFKDLLHRTCGRSQNRSNVFILHKSVNNVSINGLVRSVKWWEHQCCYPGMFVLILFSFLGQKLKKPESICI